MGVALPDCRDYEQVSPADVNVDAQGLPGSVQSSPLGGRVRYWSVTPFPIAGACALNGAKPDYISTRQETGRGAWSTEGVLPCEAVAGGKIGFSEDLSEEVVWAEGAALSAGAPLSGRSYYVRYTEPVGERYRLLATVGNGSEEDALFMAGFSGDGTHLIFETKEHLLPQATIGVENTYEVDLEKPPGEQLSLVGVLPSTEGGKAPTSGSVAGAGAHPWPGLASLALHYTQSAISQDGSLVFFMALPSERLYVRENANQPQSPLGAKDECTIPADACTLAVSQGTAHFRTATPNGLYAFYTEGENLYRYDTETGAHETLAEPTTATTTGSVRRGVSGLLCRH